MCVEDNKDVVVVGNDESYDDNLHPSQLYDDDDQSQSPVMIWLPLLMMMIHQILIFCISGTEPSHLAANQQVFIYMSDPVVKLHIYNRSKSHFGP